MNEIMQQISKMSTPALCVMILALAAYLVAMLRKTGNHLKNEADSQKADKYIDMATNAVEDAVKATAQTFVDALKAGGVFTKEKQIEAFNTAKTTALAILGETAVAALTEIYGDFDTWINTRIEAQCRAIKWPDVATTAVSAAATMCEATAQMLSIGIIDDETEGDTEAEAMEDPEALHREDIASTFMHDSYE